MGKLYGVSLDYLLNDDAEESTKVEKSPIELPQGQEFIVINKKRAAKIVGVLLVVMAIAAGIYMTAFPKNEENNPVPLHEMASDAEVDYPDMTFSFD